MIFPHFGVVESDYFFNSGNWVSRTTTRDAQSERRVWRREDCRTRLSVTTGTVLHGTKVPLRI